MELTTPGAEVRFGPFRVDPRQGLWRGDRELRVTPKALSVLYALARRSGEVVAKAELLAAVWAGRVVSDAALSSCIREVRVALGDDARRPRYIETVHRRGFRLLIRSAPAPLRPQTNEPAATSQAPAALGDAGPSIVVLPFDTISAALDDHVIARGLVHDIITRIARSRAMFIVARGTAFALARTRDIGAVSERLGVRYVLQGNVQISGDRLKVSVALADTATGREVWAEEYHRKITDFMRIQEDIAELVVASVETEVERVEIRRALLMPSSNLDAWSAYHRGLHHLYKFTPSDCARAAAFLERSVVLEPEVPRPYAALSFVHFERAFLRIGGDRHRDIARAFDLAHQSLAIDPRDPMGHWALSRAYLLTGELQTAKSALHTAVDINPSYAVAQYTLGWVALQIGENDLCLDRVGFARRLSPYDPLSFAMLGVYALNLAIMGRTNEAASIALQSTLRPNAHHLALAFAAVTHALDGQTDCARDLLSRTRAVHPGYGLEDFLGVFQFQRENDISLLRGAFAAMETTSPRRRTLQHDA